LHAKELRVIRGERLYLRSVERDDLARCHDWMNDPDLRATLAQRYPMSLAKEADSRRDARQDLRDDVRDLPDAGDRHIGNCDRRHRPRQRHRYAGILIGEADCRGQGLMRRRS
jgi:RimJ/RimL family protein N-acetyltransferase